MDSYLPTLLEAMDCAVLLEDPRYHLLYLNQAACRLFGIAEPTELLGEDHSVFEHLARATLLEAEDFLLRTREHMAAGQPVPRIEVLTRCGDRLAAEYRPLFKHSRLAYHLWLFRRQDHRTEAKHASPMLEERTRELNTLVNLSPDGFIFVDANHQVSFVNQAFEAMTGLRQQDLIGIDYEVLNQSMAALCDAPLPPARDDKDDSLTLTRPRPTILKRRIRTLNDDNRNFYGIVQYYRDITHETEVDRMKSEFLSTAAHELRTPMASVFGFTELLLQHKFAPEKERSFLEIIHRQAGQLVNLVNELLDLARIEARAGKDFKLAEHSLPPIIHSAIAEHLPAGDLRQVDLQLSARLPKVVVDPDKLQLALNNVITNAYKYSLGQGSITLSTHLRHHREERQVGITVSDQGIGMAPEQVARIFERFYRADTSGKIPGTGLGMSLVKEIMDIFLGSIEIHSRLGAGTSVTLWLPAAKPQRARAGRGKADA